MHRPLCIDICVYKHISTFTCIYIYIYICIRRYTYAHANPSSEPKARRPTGQAHSTGQASNQNSCAASKQVSNTTLQSRRFRLDTSKAERQRNETFATHAQPKLQQLGTPMPYTATQERERSRFARWRQLLAPTAAPVHASRLCSGWSAE